MSLYDLLQRQRLSHPYSWITMVYVDPPPVPRTKEDMAERWPPISEQVRAQRQSNIANFRIRLAALQLEEQSCPRCRNISDTFSKPPCQKHCEDRVYLKY